MFDEVCQFDRDLALASVCVQGLRARLKDINNVISIAKTQICDLRVDLPEDSVPHEFAILAFYVRNLGIFSAACSLFPYYVVCTQLRMHQSPWLSEPGWAQEAWLCAMPPRHGSAVC